MKEFYSNLIDLTNKRIEVIIRGTKVVYSEATINMTLGLLENGDEYQELLEKYDDQDYDIIMASLCNEGTRWLESSFEKMVRRMDMRPKSKVWYQFLKHFLRPTTHNETVSKSILLLLHCITSMSKINIGKIIVQEINACSKRKDGMVYFHCLITLLCMHQGVPEKATDEIYQP